MKYFFILGKNPTLSLAEIVSVLDLKSEQILFLAKEALVIDSADDLDVKNLLSK